MTNNEAIHKCHEILVSEDTNSFLDTNESFDTILKMVGSGGVIVIDAGTSGDDKIGPIYELVIVRSISWNDDTGEVQFPDEYDTARLSRKIYMKLGDDWDSDETIVKEFSIKQVKRDYKLGLLGINKK